jgi:hypothetical protein
MVLCFHCGHALLSVTSWVLHSRARVTQRLISMRQLERFAVSV